MSLKARLAHAFTRLLDAALPEPGRAAKEAAFREAYGTTIDADEDQWRKLTGDVDRDLTAMDQARMQKIALFLWERNVLANRLVELPVAFLLAEGVKLEVDDEENQKHLDRFWLDPINDMDVKLPKKVRELSIFGEQCYPAFINTVDGMVRIGYLDPSLIETVVKDPDNPEQPIGIVTVKDRKGRARRYRVIINGDEDVFTARTQQIRATFTDGDAFYFRVNDLSSGSRGRSDLLPQADWLDAYDQFLFGEVERYAALRSFFWDVTLKNATDKQVEERARKIAAPKPGSVRVHNDAEEWDEVTPDLKAQDTSEGARLIRNHVLGGATIPEHWFGGGGDVNRAVGAEMETPTLKIYTMRQKVLKHMLESIGRYVLFQMAKAEGTKPDWSGPAWKVQAVLPELSEKDLSKQTSALSQVAAACAALITQNLVTRKFALQLISIIAGKLGVELDPEQELKDAEAEAKKRAEEQRASDNFTAPPGAGAGEDDDKAELKEAMEMIREVAQRSDECFAALERIARDGGGEGQARFLEALQAASSAQTQSVAALVEAIAKHSGVKHEFDFTLRHGSTVKKITTPSGAEFTLTERDAP